MSIAVSAVVKPSRIISFLLGGVCLDILFVGVIFATGQVGAWTLLPRLVVASGFVLLTWFGYAHIVKRRSSHHIDISGAGQIRLWQIPANPRTRDVGFADRDQGEVVRLLADSTLWSSLLLLRFLTKDGRIIVMPILPDCVPADDFRALAAACRWIAGRKHSSASKIL